MGRARKIYSYTVNLLMHHVPLTNEIIDNKNNITGLIESRYNRSLNELVVYISIVSV